MSDGLDDPVVTAARDGDESAFAELFERYRGELRVHCYRMLGSFDDAEDLVQETFLRAWKKLDTFEGRSSFRAWLYRIATNACLDALDGRARRLLPHHLSGPSDPRSPLPPRAETVWLQPIPDRLLEPVAPRDTEPEAATITRETIELAFLTATQHLAPRQRAVLILRDVLGWPASQTATLLETTVAAVNSALQRARATMKEHLPERRLDWAATSPSAAERAVVHRYVDAVQRADLAAVADLLAAEVRATMPPWPMWFQGRDAVLGALTASWDPAGPAYVGQFRMVAVQANRQPAAAAYLRAPGGADFLPFAIGVLRIDGGRIVEVTAFHNPELFPAFGLPALLR